MDGKACTLCVIALLVLSSALAETADAATVQYVASFESGWDGWESVGGANSYQRGTGYSHGGSYSVYTASAMVMTAGPAWDYQERSYYHIRKYFVWGDVVELSAWYRPVGQPGATSLQFVLYFANGTFIHGAWLASASGNEWAYGYVNLTDEVEQEDFDTQAMKGLTVLLTLDTEWYDSGTQTLYSGHGAIDDVNLTVTMHEEPVEAEEPSTPNPQIGFKLASLDLGEVTAGEQVSFKMNFSFTGTTLTLQSVRFTGEGSEWLSTETILPKSYQGNVERSFQVVANLPQNASQGTYTVNVYATAVVDGYTVSSSATVSFKVAGSGGVGFGAAVEKIKETLIRLLGDPSILLLLLLLVAILSYYSLRNRS